MLVICWFTLFCLSANAADIIKLSKEFGDNVTLKCSAAECPHSIEGYIGMYLYKDLKEKEEVFYYHSMSGTNDKITPRERFIDRIRIKGPLRDHTITISNLTMDDAGLYRCVYIGISHGDVQCNVYALFVEDTSRAAATAPAACQPHPAPPQQAQVPPEEGGLSSAAAGKTSAPLVSTITAACALSSLATAIFILLMLLMVKKCRSSKCRRLAKVSQTSEDFVYEVMTKNGFHPVAPPEQSSSSDEPV